MKSFVTSVFFLLLTTFLSAQVTVSGTGCTIPVICFGAYSNVPADNTYRSYDTGARNIYGVETPTNGLLMIAYSSANARWEIKDGCSDVTIFFTNSNLTAPDPPNTGWTVGMGACAGASAPTLSGNVTILPVELTSFTAKAQTNSVALAWQTASEENNAGFELERSTDGRSFRTLKFVEGQGNTADRQDYSYEDTEVKAGQQYYYRLKQIDFDGRFTYSSTERAQIIAQRIAVELAPNPTINGQVTLAYSTFESGRLNLAIYDATGRMHHQESFAVNNGINTLDLNLNQLAKGIYFVKTAQNDQTDYQKLVIE